MAYVLGFFAADGSMIQNNRGAHFIEFYVTDRQILMDIRQALGSNHKVGIRKRDEKWKTGYRLQIGSKEYFHDLTRLGFSQKKSKTLVFPKVPSEYLEDFVRGYFDGDGCVYFRRHKVKGRKTPVWVFTTRFTSGSRAFLETIHSILLKNIVRGGFILNKQRGYELVFSRKDSIALYNLMYHNSPRIYLKRKYRMFRKAIETLYGS